MMVLLSPSISYLRPPPCFPPMDFAAKSALFHRRTTSFHFFFSRDHRWQRPCDIPAQVECRLPRFPSLTAKNQVNYSDMRASFTAEAQTTEPVASGAVIVRFWLQSLRILAFGALAACGVLAVASQRAAAANLSVAGPGVGFLGYVQPALRGSWPKVLQVLQVFKEQGLILAALLGLSAFFSMAETSITTLWPWKVRELADKEPENGVFRMLSTDVTRFLTTILIGTTVVNIGATALVTEAATTIFGEAGVSAATAVMTVRFPTLFWHPTGCGCTCFPIFLHQFWY